MDHCQLSNCPHRDELTVELDRLVPPPDYSYLINNGGPQEEVDMEEQCVGTQRVSSGETPIASCEGNFSMGAAVLATDRASPFGISTNEGNRVPRRC